MGSNSPAPPLPRPRLTIRLGPLPETASVMPVDTNTSQDSPLLSPAPAHDHRPIAQESVAMPPDTTPRNVRLEHAQVGLSKKRKPLSDNKVLSSSTKKTKTSPGALAMPPAGNSIKLVPSHIYTCYTNDPSRSICMQDWNKHQPGGQGLAADFEVYYKKLSEAERQVRSHKYNLTI